MKKRPTLRSRAGQAYKHYRSYRNFGAQFLRSLISGRRDKAVLLFGKWLRYTDEFWLLYALNETFVDELYLFETPNRRPLIIDCGSNVGISILYFKRLFPDATVIGFEPDPANFEILVENVRSFGLGDVELIQKALWNQDTVVTFAADGSVGSHVVGDKLGRRDQPEKNLIKVGAIPLAPFLTGRAVDFLKIDIEGAEYEVLLSCREHLRNVRNLFVEYHSSPNRPQALGDLLLMLRDAGFRYYIRPAWDNQRRPFVNERTKAYDLQLNIFAYRAAAAAALATDDDVPEPELLRRRAGA